MFYKRKLNLYNLTGHLSRGRQGYCMLWHEGQAGRGGNDIASAVVEMLNKVVQQEPVTELILWADSCVPQNRNSMMSVALLKFLTQQTQLNKLTQKFCEPGNSSIQEVDNLHSQIERSLRYTEVFSPLGVMRLMLSVNRRKPLNVTQMTPSHFLSLAALQSQLNLA